MHESTTRHRTTARDGRGASFLGRAVAFALVGLTLLWVTQLDLGAVVDPRPDTVHAVYAVAADQPIDPEMPSSIRNEVAIVQRWFEDETDGRSLRVAEADGRLAVEIQRLELSTAEIQRHPDPFGYVADEVLAADGRDDDDLPLVFVSAYIWSRGYCGEANSSGIAVVWGGGCVGGPLTGSRTMGDGATDVIAHELVHALGGVQPCAPNYDGDGHVDDSDDIIDGGNKDWVRAPALHLDPGRDDYYGTDGTCSDIAGHPAWR